MRSWREMWRAVGYKQLSLSVASAAAGALLGAGVQNFTDSKLRVVSIIAVVLCLGLVAVYASLTFRDRENMRSNQALREQAAQDTSSIISTISRLEKQVGVQILHQLVSEINDTTPLREDLLAKTVEDAEFEILILDLLSKTGRRPDTSQDHRLESYYSNLVRRTTEGVVYRRILQVEDPELRLSYLAHTPFRKHCQDVFQVREEKRNWYASIRVARRRYPYNFLIIDQKIVAVQLLREGESSAVDEQLNYCNLIISDPSGDLVEVFLNMWNDVLEATDTRTPTLKDFDTDAEVPT
jgi:hypothetical protein